MLCEPSRKFGSSQYTIDLVSEHEHTACPVRSYNTNWLVVNESPSELDLWVRILRIGLLVLVLENHHSFGRHLFFELELGVAQSGSGCLS